MKTTTDCPACARIHENRDLKKIPFEDESPCNCADQQCLIAQNSNETVGWNQPHKGSKDGGIAIPKKSIAPPQYRSYIATEKFGLSGRQRL
ncbi:hypothetical protein L195_g042125 [Trifolium pratense]|uniref:Uncharacterized protein n=1 Tax=Trifolium pratense TaxID=57577 RepID=A0A2K3M5K1_TRIPR|nr:hypothetical protein L195_g042125 [Trifolium pratense]